MRVRDTEAFQQRVSHAARVIAAGGETNRTFDSCFEMSDGDAVVIALYRRARKNPRLRRNLWRYISRNTVIPKVWEHRRCKNLSGLARALRAKAQAEFDRWMDEHRAAQA